MKNMGPTTPTLFRDKSSFTPDQELLLRASLLKTKEALGAWDEFKSRVDIGNIDRNSFRILPLLYKNLVFHGVQDRDLERLKGVYRQAWYKNQMLFHAMHSALCLLENTGIATMIIGGAPLALFYYKDCGLRSMTDFDVMIRQADLPRAVELLLGAGWQPLQDWPLNRLTQSVRDARGFRDAQGHDLDLHWRLFRGYCVAGAEDDFWRDSLAMQFDSLPVRVLNPTDQLLYILMRRGRRDGGADLRWVADAALLLNDIRAPIDWQRLIGYAQKMSFSLSVKNNSDYLNELVGILVPQEVLREFAAARVSEIERMAWRAETNSNDITGMLPANFYRYLIYAKKKKSISAFMEFLRLYWGKEGFFRLAAAAASKTIKRLGFKISHGKKRSLQAFM